MVKVRLLSRRYLIIWIGPPRSLVLLSAVIAAVVGAGVWGFLAPGSGRRGGRAVGGTLAQRRQLWGGVPTAATGVIASVEGARE